MVGNTKEKILETRLSKCFSAFKEGSGVPPWLVSHRTAATLVNQAEKWIDLLPLLGFTQTLSFFQKSPYFEQIPMELVREESKRWADCNQIRDALLAANRLLCSVLQLWYQGKLAHTGIVLKTLPVVCALFWSAEGGRIISEVATILSCNVVTPAQVFDSYRLVVESSDKNTLQKIAQLVDSNPAFSSWTKRFLNAAKKVDLPQRAKALPFTSLVPDILLRMLETEEENDDNRGDTREAQAG